MAEKFYGDAVEKFRAMAKSTGGCDEAHFRMWCSIAADEIEEARNAAAKRNYRATHATKAHPV